MRYLFLHPGIDHFFQPDGPTRLVVPEAKPRREFPSFFAPRYLAVAQFDLIPDFGFGQKAFRLDMRK
jgi:hypothetical protein